MSSLTVHVLHQPVVPPIAFLRVGYAGHRKFKVLRAVKRLRDVFEVFHEADAGAASWSRAPGSGDGHESRGRPTAVAGALS